jgi:23S rRNA (uridine2552-2'-O)-methyltransferase
VIGVDLQRIKPFDEDNFIGIRGDFTTNEIQEEILSKTDERIDIIISDAAPSLTGIKDIDQLNSMDLANNVMRIASNLLKPKGNLVMKSFQGPQYPRLLKKLNGEFKVVKTYKPESSRNASAEMFIIGLGYKNKKWVDLEL